MLNSFTKSIFNVTKISMIGIMLVVSAFSAVAIASASEVSAKPSYNCPANFRERPMLQRGSRGGCVKQLQYELNMVRNRTPGTPGYFEELVVDGIYGEKTEKAVKKFQRTHTVRINGRDQKLRVDGIVGPKTWKAIYQAIIS